MNIGSALVVFGFSRECMRAEYSVQSDACFRCEAAQEKPQELASESPGFGPDWASMESAWRVVIHGGGRKGHTWLSSVESWDLLGLCRWFLAPGSSQVDPLSLYGCVWMWPVWIGLVPTRQIIRGSGEAWSALVRSSSLFELDLFLTRFHGEPGISLAMIVFALSETNLGRVSRVKLHPRERQDSSLL